MLLSACLFALLDHGSAQFAWSSQTSECARMDGDQSNIWADQQNGFRWNFDLHIRFPLGADPDFMEKTVRVKFARPLSILRVEPQGSVSAVNGGVDFVEVEVTPSYVGHEYFSIQGFREGGGSHEDLLSPEISCAGGTDVPPPMPPGPPSCDLQPVYGSYPLGGQREAGSDVTIKLSKWTPFRVFSMVYFGQEGLLVSKPQGVTIISNPQRFTRNGDTLIGFTFSLDPQGSDGLRCEGHPACIEFEAKPAPHHRPHITCVDSPPPTPPVAPPLPPPPSPNPPTIFPPPPAPVMLSPPPPARISATSSCELGASARVVDVRQTGATATVRIAVDVNRWLQGAVVTLGVDGTALVVSRTIRATATTHGPTLEVAMRSFSFSLGEEPIEASVFAVVLEGQHWGGLIAVDCSSNSRSAPSTHHSSQALPGTDGRTGTDSYGDDTATSGEDSSASSSYGGSVDLAAPAAVAQTSSTGFSALLIGLLVMLIIGGAVVGTVWYRRQHGGSPLSGALTAMCEKRPQNRSHEKESLSMSMDDDTELGPPSPQHPARSAVASLPVYTSSHHGLSLDMDDDDDGMLILSRPEVI